MALRTGFLPLGVATIDMHGSGFGARAEPLLLAALWTIVSCNGCDPAGSNSVESARSISLSSGACAILKFINIVYEQMFFLANIAPQKSSVPFLC